MYFFMHPLSELIFRVSYPEFGLYVKRKLGKIRFELRTEIENRSKEAANKEYILSQFKELYEIALKYAKDGIDNNQLDGETVDAMMDSIHQELGFVELSSDL